MKVNIKQILTQSNQEVRTEVHHELKGLPSSTKFLSPTGDVWVVEKRILFLYPIEKSHITFHNEDVLMGDINMDTEEIRTRNITAIEGRENQKVYQYLLECVW